MAFIKMLKGDEVFVYVLLAMTGDSGERETKKKITSRIEKE